MFVNISAAQNAVDSYGEETVFISCENSQGGKGVLTLIDLAGVESADVCDSIEAPRAEEAAEKLQRNEVGDDISEGGTLIRKRKAEDKRISKSIRESLREFKLCVLSLGNTKPEALLSSPESDDTLTNLIRQNLKSDDKIYLMLHLNASQRGKEAQEILAFGTEFRILVSAFVRRMAEIRKREEPPQEEKPSRMSNILSELKDEQPDAESRSAARKAEDEEPAGPKTVPGAPPPPRTSLAGDAAEEKKIPSELVSRMADLLSLPNEPGNNGNVSKTAGEGAVEASVSKINKQKESGMGSFFSQEENALYTSIKRNSAQLHEELNVLAMTPVASKDSESKAKGSGSSPDVLSYRAVDPFLSRRQHQESLQEGRNSWWRWAGSWLRSRSRWFSAPSTVLRREICRSRFSITIS